MPPIVKKVLIGLGVLSLLGAALVISLIAWVILRETEAKRLATALCNATPVGSASAMIDLAELPGTPDWRDAGDGRRELRVIFAGGAPRSGYACVLIERDGRITAADLEVLD